MSKGITVPFSVDSTRFKRGLDNMRRDARNFGKKIDKNFQTFGGMKGLTAGIAAASIAAGALAMESLTMGKELKAGAETARLGVEELQAAIQAALDTGAERDNVIQAFKTLELTSQQAAEGSASHQEALKSLGIEYKAFSRLTMEQKIDAIAQAYVKANGSAKAFNAITVLMGEDATKLTEALKRIGTEGLATMTAEMKKANKILTEDQISALNQASAIWHNFFNEIKVQAAQATAALAKMAGITGPDVDSRTAEQRLGLSDQGVKFSDVSKKERIRLLANEKGIEDKNQRIKQLEAELQHVELRKKNATGEGGRSLVKISENKVKSELSVVRAQLRAQQRESSDIIKKAVTKKQAIEGLKASKTLLKSLAKGAKGFTFGFGGGPNLDSLEESKTRPSVKVSSLQAIGGGGGIAGIDMSMKTELGRQTEELRINNMTLEEIKDLLQEGAHMAGTKLQ